MGEDQPRPGTSIFQATFSFVLQRSGRPGLSATPIAPGPRNCGQFATGSAASAAPASNGRNKQATRDPIKNGKTAPMVKRLDVLIVSFPSSPSRLLPDDAANKVLPTSRPQSFSQF